MTAAAAPAAPAVAPPPQRELLRGLVLLAFSSGLVVSWTRSSFAVLYPAMSLDQGWSKVEVTGAFSLAMLMYSLGSAVTGWLADRFGVRRTMVLGALLVVGGTLATMLVDSLSALYATWGVGIGLGSSAVGFVALIRALVRVPSRIGLGLSCWQLGMGVGALLAGPGLGAVIDTFGWRTAHGVLALVQLLHVPVVLAFAPGRAAHGPGHAAAASAVDERLSWRAFGLVFAALFAFGFTQLVLTHQVAHMVDRGLSFGDAAAVAGLTGVMLTVGGMGLGWASDRWPLRVQVGGGLAFAVGALAFVLAGPGALLPVALAVAGAGAGRGILGVSMGVIETRILPPRRIGTLAGVLEIAVGLGAFAGPWLGAALREATGSFTPALLTNAALALAAPVLSVWAYSIARGWPGRRPPRGAGGGTLGAAPPSE